MRAGPKRYGRSVPRRGLDWNRRAGQQSKCDWWKEDGVPHATKALTSEPCTKASFPRISGILVNSGPPVSKIAISKESFQGPAPKKVTPQPNAFWTVEMQLVKRVR